MFKTSPTPQQRGELRRLLRGFTLSSSIFAALLIFLLPREMWRLALTSYAIFTLAMLSIQLLGIFYPGKPVLQEFGVKVSERHGKLEHNQKLYVNVLLFGVLTAYVYVAAPPAYFRAFLLLYACYCYGIAIFDIVRAYKWLSGSLIGKALIAIGFALGSNLAFSMAAWVVSGITSAPSSAFPHTKSFVAIGTIPFLLIIAGAVLNAVLIIAAPFILMTSSFAEDHPKLMQFVLGTQMGHRSRHYVFITFCFQVIFYGVLLTAAPRIAKFVLERYGKGIESAISHSIYLFDMHLAKECGLKGNYRYVALGDENYLPARESAVAIVFDSPIKCGVPPSVVNNP